MAWISWSRTWATTRRTTTTSRKPPRWSSKILRWNRMHVLWQADQRLKQNHKDVLFPAHPQEFYPSGKESGLILNQEPSGKKTKHSSSAWTITSRRRWCDWILENKGISSEQIWALSILVWRYVEEQDGRRRRQQQEKISILYWPVRTRNSLSLSSSRSFRTQSLWSFITGHCINPDRFLRVHLSHRMCNQFTLHREFRIDTRRTKFEQKTDGILHVCGSNEQGTWRSRWNWLECTASCLVQAKSVEETSKHGVLGWHQTCSKERI